MIADGILNWSGGPFEFSSVPCLILKEYACHSH